MYLMYSLIYDNTGKAIPSVSAAPTTLCGTCGCGRLCIAARILKGFFLIHSMILSHLYILLDKSINQVNECSANSKVLMS